MEILVVTPHISPYGRATLIGDACAALPKALRTLGHRITVVSPLYSSIDRTRFALARRLLELEFDLDGAAIKCELWDGRTAAGVDVLFLGHADTIGRVDRMDATNPRAAGVFARATVELLRRRDPKPEVVHVHDGVGALATLLARSNEVALPPVTLSIHEPVERFSFARSDAAALGLTSGALEGLGLRAGGKILPIIDAMKAAAHTFFVSSELATATTQNEPVTGRTTVVAYGIDAATWNPATDPFLRAHFDPMDLSGKARCKSELQHALELPVSETPLLGGLNVGTAESGFDLFAAAATELLRNDVQIVLQGTDTGAPHWHELQSLAETFPDRFRLRASDDERLSHAIIAASDLIALPARDEPVGIGHLLAQRYGALPIVRRVGDLARAVVDCDAKLESGSGFVFDDANPSDFLAAARRALAAYHIPAFADVAARVMQSDHSWDRSARLLDAVYRGLAST